MSLKNSERPRAIWLGRGQKGSRQRVCESEEGREDLPHSSLAADMEPDERRHEVPMERAATGAGHKKEGKQGLRRQALGSRAGYY